MPHTRLIIFFPVFPVPVFPGFRAAAYATEAYHNEGLQGGPFLRKWIWSPGSFPRPAAGGKPKKRLRAKRESGASKTLSRDFLSILLDTAVPERVDF